MHRRRSPPHARPPRPRRCTCRSARHRSGAAQRAAPPAAPLEPARPSVHRRPHRGVGGARSDAPRIPPERVGAGVRDPCVRPRPRGPGHRRRAVADHLLDDGRQPEPAGTFASNAIINLHLASGQIGRPGCGPFSLTGQPNAMGGRDGGYMSHLLPGQRQIANPDHRRQMEQLWGLAAGTIHPHAGLRRRPACSMRSSAARSRHLDRRHQPCGVACRTCRACARRWRRRSW